MNSKSPKRDGCDEMDAMIFVTGVLLALTLMILALGGVTLVLIRRLESVESAQRELSNRINSASR